MAKYSEGVLAVEMGGKVTEFWKERSLSELSKAEWESLCDGCGRCCLHKLEDEDTGELRFTSVSCFELDLTSSRCRHYETRHERVPDCLVLNADMDPKVYGWLPPTCAYRLLSEGKGLFPWHPLVSGRKETVVEAGIGIAAIAISEMFVDEDDLEDYCISIK